MGAGTITSRLGALQFAKTAGIDVQLVPFKGSAEIGQAVLAGTVDFALDSTGTSLPLIQGGHYRALAKYSNRPLPMLPDLPSLSVAANLAGLDESSTWVALVAPAGTPPAIIDKIHREVAAHLRRPGHYCQTGKGRASSRRQHHAGGVRRLYPQRDRTLVPRFQAERRQGQIGLNAYCAAGASSAARTRATTSRGVAASSPTKA